MSRRRVAFSAIAAVALLVGAAALWQDGQPSSRNAHVLLLDPRTGRTLHEQITDGGYAVVALLRGGWVAVGTMDSCLKPQQGGRIAVFDAQLAHVISTTAVDPCVVARLDNRLLRMRFEPGNSARNWRQGPGTVTVPLGRGKLVEYQKPAGLRPLIRIAAFDADGRMLWQRSDLGEIGLADVRDGRLLLSTEGAFTPGSD
jgi:hypothetical protein